MIPRGKAREQVLQEGRVLATIRTREWWPWTDSTCNGPPVGVVGSWYSTDSSLAAVIERLNHYRPGRVVLANDALAQRQVSGVFHLDMLDAALASLTQELKMQRLDLPGVSLIY